ncbi:hypothetical protein [Streptomyces sp. NPDC094468]|uniref:hypothetical protein n=1 Tax=Streptomyces sp. NPDC094468 TaxID=3366066 RepID=UPI0037FA3B08
MNYRPYPRTKRALDQVQRGRIPDPALCPVCTHPVGRHAVENGHPVCTRGQGPISCRDCAEQWARTPAVAPFAELGRLLNWGSGDRVLIVEPRQLGKTAVVNAVAEQAVRAGEHVHFASRDGVRCLGVGAGATVFGRSMIQAGVAREAFQARALAAAGRCANCGHAQHPAGTECEAGVDHGRKRWHRCLCLAMAGAAVACPPQMNCQGGTLGYADIVHLREGGSLRGADGVTITPAALGERPRIVLARVVRTCTAVPSQWNAWTVADQYLYMRYRSGIGTVDAYDHTDSDQWTRVPDGSVSRFDTGDRLDGEMSLVEFCRRADLQLADDAEVIGE